MNNDVLITVAKAACDWYTKNVESTHDYYRDDYPCPACVEETEVVLSAALPVIRDHIAAQIFNVGAAALGVYTDEYQAGLLRARHIVLTGETTHPDRLKNQ